MTEIKTPFDEDAENAALRGDYNRATSFRNMALGYRAALSREVVPEAEIEAVLESFGLYKPEWEQVSAMTKAIAALRLPKMTPDRLVEIIRGVRHGDGDAPCTECDAIADAILGGSEMNEEDKDRILPIAECPREEGWTMLDTALLSRQRELDWEVLKGLVGHQDDVIHASDCAVHNPPASPAGPCNCNPKE